MLAWTVASRRTGYLEMGGLFILARNPMVGLWCLQESMFVILLEFVFVLSLNLWERGSVH